MLSTVYSYHVTIKTIHFSRVYRPAVVTEGQVFVIILEYSACSTTHNTKMSVLTLFYLFHTLLKPEVFLVITKTVLLIYKYHALKANIMKQLNMACMLVP